MKKAMILLAVLGMLAALAAPAAADGAYLIPDSATRRLTEDELWLWQYDALGYVLNEIFARHGYHFEAGGEYERYFKAKDWYAENTRYATNQQIYQNEMTSVEWYNERLVKQVREQMRARKFYNPNGRSVYDAQQAWNGMLVFTESGFPRCLKFDVYSGPGRGYLRGANGKASVSTNDVVYIAGTDGGWALVLYETNGGSMRAGYANAQESIELPYASLRFSRASATVSSACQLTDDPVLASTQLGSLAPGARVTYLAAYSRLDDWAYVEAQVSGGVARGFVPMRCLAF